MTKSAAFPGRLGATRFRHPWRQYQARVLAALDVHLDDDHLHLVAPPGSGKTVLGLEVVRRRGVPALILAPTITIREQWMQRLTEDFISDSPVPVSRDPGQPAEVTVCTYQGLHQRWKEAADLDQVLARGGVETLVVDECHHLRRAWWRTLEALKEGLQARGNLTVVGLTATPPYDAPAAEWNRYRTFCGPLDEEIAVPELVNAANLCPHQDLLLLAEPDGEATERLLRFDEGIEALVGDLALDFELVEALANEPRVREPTQGVDSLLEASELYLAVAVFLGGLRWEAAQALITELGLMGVVMPRLDRAWAEPLLQGVVDGTLDLPPDIRSGYRRRLGELGALERGRVQLRTSLKEVRKLRFSPSKVEGVCRIVELESRLDPLDLRLVVLTDHIRKGALGGAEGAPLGVVPIFEAIRRRRLDRVRLGILTGSLVVLPREAAATLQQVADGDWSTEPLAHDPRFVRLDSGADHGVTGAVTELLSRGRVNVLVGTAALLGEGWDAPALSTLVLATAIGSHVMSNQMRGRAIRVEPGNPCKAAHIWHVGCVVPSANEQGAGGWAPTGELARLERRFQAFIGPALDSDVLESGVGRLGLMVDRGLARADIARVNRRMCSAAGDRSDLGEIWARCLDRSDSRSGELRREIMSPVGFWAPSLTVDARGELRGFLALIGRWWAGRRLLRVGRAVARALEECGSITSDGRPVVDFDRGSQRLGLALEGASYLDRSRFTVAVAEVFDCLTSPRYLLLHRENYWAVPTEFGVNRRLADLFVEAWQRRVGRSELIYTRAGDGRHHLLRAKQTALLRADPLRVSTRMRWTAGR